MLALYNGRSSVVFSIAVEEYLYLIHGLRIVGPSSLDIALEYSRYND